MTNLARTKTLKFLFLYFVFWVILLVVNWTIFNLIDEIYDRGIKEDGCCGGGNWCVASSSNHCGCVQNRELKKKERGAKKNRAFFG